MKGNIHKKLYNEDKFARKFYCEHARLNQLRYDKYMSRKAVRRASIVDCNNGLFEYYDAQNSKYNKGEMK